MVLDLCVLYDTHRIVESYECNEFADYAPGYISIGNDNGDRELIIKAEKGAVQCGFLDAAELGEGESEEWFDFKLWVENGCEMEQNDDEDDGYGNVYITRIPDEKLKFLAETKKTFALSISTGVLYKQVNTLPCVIVRQITEAKADILYWIPLVITRTVFPVCSHFPRTSLLSEFITLRIGCFLYQNICLCFRNLPYYDTRQSIHLFIKNTCRYGK